MLPVRKPQRLQNYDYSQNNAYFITICTYNKISLLGQIVDGEMRLNSFGNAVKKYIQDIETIYDFQLINSVVMPNHIHLLILISNCETSGTTQRSFPTISDCIQRFKSVTTHFYINNVKRGICKPYDKKIWQKSFHDHIIRNKNDYLNIWQYIENNPQKWYYDCFYNES